MMETEIERQPVVNGFHGGALSWLNWNLVMLVFVWRGKPENQEKNPWGKVTANNNLNPQSCVVSGRNRTQATLVEVQCSYRYATCCTW